MPVNFWFDQPDLMGWSDVTGYHPRLFLSRRRNDATRKSGISRRDLAASRETRPAFNEAVPLAAFAKNWIANARQETADRPADLGYLVGYWICKAYYLNAKDKKQAARDILNIKEYKDFYEKNNVEEMVSRM